MMMRLILLTLFFLKKGAEAVCVDTVGFTDDNGEVCQFYEQYTNCRENAILTELGMARVLANCQKTCGTCVKANDYCEIGQDGDKIDVAPRLANFEFLEQVRHSLFLRDNALGSVDWPMRMGRTSRRS